MGDAPVPVDPEHEADGEDEPRERSLTASKPGIPQSSTSSDPSLPDGGMTPDKDVIGSG